MKAINDYSRLVPFCVNLDIKEIIIEFFNRQLDGN